MSDLIMPLTERQLKQLNQELDESAKPVRFLADGRACCITTGYCFEKFTNVIYHPVYWDRPKIFIDQVVEFLKENNKNVKITTSYH